MPRARRVSEAVRNCAAARFEAVHIDDGQFLPDRWCERSREEQNLTVLALSILGDDDEELTRKIPVFVASVGQEKFMDFVQRFEEWQSTYEATAELFGVVHTRLLIAATRWSNRLDRDGRPLPAGSDVVAEKADGG